MPARILVVEDEQIVAMDIQRTLETLGYSVPATAAAADAAVQKAAELRPDLVLMDIRLQGGGDGIAAAAEIRERYGLPVVYLTAHADPGTLARAKITEPFGYVLKPFEERELHTAIEMALYKHEMERRLRASERWLSVTLTSIGDGVIATDAVGQVVFINPVAERLTGWPAHEAIGRPLAEVFRIVNEQTRQPVDNPVSRVMETGMIVGLANHTLLIARDGSELPIDDSGAPIRVPDGELLGAVLVFRDITERRELEQALEARAAELALTDRRKDEFLAMLSHELRNPLAGIVNSLEVLNHGPVPQADAAPLLAIVRRQADQLRHITDDLLDVTRIKHGKIVLKRSPMDIVPVVRQAAEDHRLGMEARGAVLHIETPAQPIYCQLDPTRLAQIVGNLLGNAAKFLGGPGEITISVSSHPSKNVATIQVRDTGMGIDAATLREMFEPFVQASQRLNRGEGGLGLGLALVRGLVELHGGRVNAASAGIGKGAQFTIELPLCPSPVSSETHRQSAQDSGRRKRVVVVDDYQDALLAICKMLEMEGHEVFTASEGGQALELARKVEPHVVLCDIGLPGMSGYEFARAVRADPRLKEVRLIAVSGYGQDEDRQRARDSGFDHHLTKPVRREQLKALIEI